MVNITARDLSVVYPVLDVSGRSLRKELVRRTVGGSIDKLKSGVYVNALHNLNFEINEGERVGLIGHNGAGKTTLLKCMAGIYEPINGVMDVSGFAFPMFDIGLGLDIEASGYENIRLLGLFLDLPGKVIDETIRDVTVFTNLGDYLYMPVKTYSSGMQVRLTFAVATSLAPDIILMDEMIGAGDATFFVKARHRMERFIERAGILVLASHSEGIIREWCTRAIVLQNGKLVADASVDEALEAYRELSLNSFEQDNTGG